MRGKLDAAVKKCDILAFLRGSHSDWDCVFYELLYWSCGVAGVKRFEEFLYIYGRTGSNAKGSRIALLLKAFGDSMTGGYISLQNSLYFTQSEKDANKPDEAAAAAMGCRLLVCDETGHGTTAGETTRIVFNSVVTKKWTDVAGTPIPFQVKYGKQDTMTVTWKMLFFGNQLPDFMNADQAFKRRPSLLELSKRFVSADEYDPSDPTLALVNNNYKDSGYLGTMLPELIHWMRRLVPALYTEKMTYRLKLQPVPSAIKGLTGEELGLETYVKERSTDIRGFVKGVPQPIRTEVCVGGGVRTRRGAGAEKRTSEPTNLRT
jgi:hypothetical protein